MKSFADRMLASSPAVIYACKTGGDYGATFVSENVRDVIGYRSEEFLEDSAFWKNHVHPEDVARVLAGAEEVFTKGCHVSEYRFLIGSGEYRWMRDEVRLVRNEETGADELVGSWLDITERKVIEENYRRIAEFTSDYVHYCTRRGDEPYRLKWVDGAVNPISGYTIDDILAMGCWLPLVHPEDRPAVSAYLSGLLPGDRKKIEFRIVTRQQEIRWVLEKSRCEAGASDGEVALLGAVTDITERKRVEEALRDSEAFLREASRIARLGRWRWNILTNHAEWSTVTREIFGLDPVAGDIVYDDFINAVHPEDRGIVGAALREALENGSDYAVEHRLVRPDGLLRYVQERGRVRRSADGEPVSMVGTVLDVTEQKLLEERLRESDRLKGEFIATASHELRTPLAVIQGFAEVLLEGRVASAEQQRDFLAIIHDKAVALEKIVDDLLDISRVESGRTLSLEFSQVDLAEEIRKVEEEFAKEAPGHRFQVELPAGPLLLFADRAKIVRVLENLLGNAVKFSPEGSTVTVTAQSLKGVAQVRVADQGVGISVNDQRHVFDKFYRADRSDTAVAGLGLGLYLVRRIIEAHHGRVWLESTPGEGAQFFFTLPLPGSTD